MITFKKFLAEGGAFGHLSNVYDVNLTFKEMMHFIHDALKGNLNYVEEKTDAVNLMVSFKNGRVIAARNKSHLKNFGENALDAAGIRLKFKDRVLEVAYGNAMDDLQDAIQSLSSKQQDKIFAQGAKWLSIEVMGHGAENIIEYGVRELRLHGTIEHNENGEQIAAIDKEAARMFDGMLRQRGTHKQGSFTIKNLNKVKLPEVSEFAELESKFKRGLQMVMKKYKLSSSDTIADMKMKVWEDILKKQKITGELHDILINRWANYIKQPTIANIKKMAPEHADWIAKMDKEQAKINKDAMLPLEKLFLALGAERLKTMSEFMAMNPDTTVQKLANKIDHAITQVRKSKNPDLINKLEMELDRLQATGHLMPTEGITFFWKGHFMKLTGSFAPANQIIGLLYRL